MTAAKRQPEKRGPPVFKRINSAGQLTSPHTTRVMAQSDFSSAERMRAVNETTGRVDTTGSQCLDVHAHLTSHRFRDLVNMLHDEKVGGASSRRNS
jgi:hypothetical protein